MMGRQRQRLEGGSQKARSARAATRNCKRPGMDLPLEASRECGPANYLILEFQLPELQGNKLLLFKPPS